MIKKIYIEKFGGIKDKEIEFSDGLNILYGENEAGKSTVQAFIKAMLYGMDAGKRTDIRQSPRKRYMPKDGKSMSGSMNILNYQITRQFGKTPKSDKCTVLDLTTGKNLDCDNIGEVLLGITSNTYSNLLSAQSYDSKIDSDDEIMTKLANLHQTSDENVSYDKALSILDAEKRKITKKSALPTVIADIESLKEQLENAKIKYIKNKENEKVLEDLKKSHEQLLKDKIIFENEKKQLNGYYDYKNYCNLKKECDSLKQQIDDLKIEDNGLGDIPNLEFSIGQVESLENDYQNIINIKSNKSYKLILIIFSALSLLGFFGFVNKLFFVFFLLFIPSFIFYKKEMDIKKSEEIHIIEGQKIKEDLKKIYNSISTNNYNEYLKRYHEIMALHDKRKFIIERLNLLINDFNDKNNTLAVLLKKVEETGILERMKQDDFKFIEPNILEQKIFDLSNKVLQSEKQIFILEEGLKNNDLPFEDMSLKLSFLEDNKKAMEDNLSCIQIAEQVLEDTFLELQQNFAPELNNKISEVYNKIVNNENISVVLSSEFQTTISQKANILEDSYLSNGTLDAVYFAVKIAIMNMIIDKNKFFVLDDALLQYDDNRANRAMQYLLDLSADMQIIYFTCQSRFSDKFYVKQIFETA